MTPEGHALAAWITLSAYRDGDEVVAQAQASERTSDPLVELSYVLGANRATDAPLEKTLANLCTSLGAAQEVAETTKVCVDRRRQWKHAGNVRHSPAEPMALSTVTAPARRIRRRRVAR